MSRTTISGSPSGKLLRGIPGQFISAGFPHNRRIGLLNKSKIRTYAAAMSDADVGHP